MDEKKLRLIIQHEIFKNEKKKEKFLFNSLEKSNYIVYLALVAIGIFYFIMFIYSLYQWKT